MMMLSAIDDGHDEKSESYIVCAQQYAMCGWLVGWQAGWADWLCVCGVCMCFSVESSEQLDRAE